LADSGTATGLEKGSSEGYFGKERGEGTDLGTRERKGDSGLA